MRVLREEPDFVAAIPAKVAPKPASLAPQQNGDGALKSSLYALLQLEKASEAAGGSRPDSRQSRPEIADEKAHGPNGGVVAENAPKDADADGPRGGAAPPAKRRKGEDGAAADDDKVADAVGGLEGRRRGAAEVAKDEATAADEAVADADGGGGEAAEGKAEDDADAAPRSRSGPYANDLEYLQDMFLLVKLRSDVARMRRHIEERGQQVRLLLSLWWWWRRWRCCFYCCTCWIRQAAGTRAAGAATDDEASDEGDDMPPLHMDEPYW